ncbi:MAG: carbohydrate-binding protein [Bacteroidaceae bacterium]|nr:carbohydrate-binding protein [Bacteroidaceae bacterium]
MNARLATKTIDHIELYVKGALYQTIKEASSVNEKTLDAAYEAEYTPAATGKYALKAIVYDTDGSTYEREGAFTAYNPRSPFKNIIAELPGTIEAENFDVGGEGVTYHDSNTNKEGDGASYRTDGGIDVVKGNNGYALGYTANGEWTEYTVNVTEAGTYSYDAYVSSGVTGASFSLSIETPDGTVNNLSEVITIPQTGNSDWSNYVPIHGRTLVSLAEGKHILRLNISGSNGNIDKFVFKHTEVDNNIKLAVTSDPAPATINTNTTLKATASSPTSTIANVSFYLDNVLLKSVSEEPFETDYKPTAKGEYAITAIATDAEGKESKIVKYTLKVNNKRTPYKSVISIPGIVQAENFDKGGEGLTFHDSDSEDQGDAKSRTDNEGVDLVKGNNGTVIGYTAVGEWLEYSVKVTESGTYSYEATVSSGVSGSGFTLGLVEDGKVTSLCKVNVPQTGSNNWDTYKVVKGNILKELEAGEHIFRITINGANCNIDKIELKLVQSSAIDEVASTPETADNNLYNLAGQKVDGNYHGIVIKNGKKFWKK